MYGRADPFWTKIQQGFPMQASIPAKRQAIWMGCYQAPEGEDGPACTVRRTEAAKTQMAIIGQSGGICKAVVQTSLAFISGMFLKLEVLN